MVFESTYFPKSIFYEHMYDVALHENQGYSVYTGVCSHFGLADVRTFQCSIAYDRYQVSGISFGTGLYRENQIVGSFRFSVLPRLRSGIYIALLNYWVQDNCSRYGYAVHTSLYFTLDHLIIGGWLNNINLPHFYEGDAIPLTYTVRLEYSLHDNLAFILANRGTHKTMPFFNAGISWDIFKYLVVGVGANTDPLYVEYMLRVPIGRIGIHYTGTAHEYLGLSHAMHLSFDL
jgi:hypothetical protein